MVVICSVMADSHFEDFRKEALIREVICSVALFTYYALKKERLENSIFLHLLGILGIFHRVKSITQQKQERSYRKLIFST